MAGFIVRSIISCFISDSSNHALDRVGVTDESNVYKLNLTHKTSLFLAITSPHPTSVHSSSLLEQLAVMDVPSGMSASHFNLIFLGILDTSIGADIK